MPNLTNEQINAGARALTQSIRLAARRRGLADTEAFAMASVAFVEIMGKARGPHGLVDFLRDLADQIEADNLRKVS